MHWDNKTKREALSICAKIAATLFLVFIIFSPFAAISTTPVARAGLTNTEDGCPIGSTLVGGRGGTGCFDSSGKPTGGATNTGSDPFKVAAEWIANIVYVFTVGLGGLIAYVASYFFNFAVYLSLSSTAYAMDFVTSGWEMVRDLANMAFIFILIYIAINIMLSAETSDTMKTLVRVIAIALVINFSFFFVRVVIDGGNILATQFYNGIGGPHAPLLKDSLSKQGVILNNAGSAPALLTGASYNAKDLTISIMGAVGVTDILNTESFKRFVATNNPVTVLITLSFIYICVGIVFGLLAAMFFTIGLKFISRVVVLWLVIIAAPLALVLRAIPNKTAEGYFKQWLNALITYSLYPAIFLFLFIIIADFASALAVCSEAARANGCTPSVVGAIFSDINRPNDVGGVAYIASIAANVGIRLGFLMLLLYLALQASNAVSKWGGEIAQNITAKPDKWAASLSGFSKRWTTAPAGALVTRPVGFAAAGINQGLSRTTWANSNKWYNPLSAGARALQKNVLQPAAKVSLAGEKSYTDYKKGWDDEMKERGTNRRIAENLPAIEELKTLIDKGTLTNPADIRRKAQLQNRIDNLSKTELEAIKVDSLVKHASVFKEAGAKKIAEIEKFSEAKKDEFRAAFEETSKDSHLQKSIDKLVDISKKSLTLQNHMQQAKTNNTPIDDTWITRVENTMKHDYDQANATFRATPSAANSAQLRDANDALRELGDFNKERKLIPPSDKINKGVGKAFDGSRLP